MAVTDLTGYTWVGSDVLTFSALSSIDVNRYYLNYIITDLPDLPHYSEFDIIFDIDGFETGSEQIFVRYDAEIVYTENDGWHSPAVPSASYKTIYIKGGTDATNADLISWLEANGTLTASITPKITVDLTTLAGWSSLSGGTHNITSVAKADSYRDSEPSAAVSVEKAPTVVMPVKGDIITLDSKQYRVLKTEGTVAEVLAMYDASTSVKFDSASSGYNNTYAGKSLDTYCNSTFYSGLSAAMKTAIVDKTFTQDSWKWDSSVPTESHYTGKSGSLTYYLTLVNAAFGDSITRHCYVLSIQDVLDYLGATTSMGISDTTLTDTNVWKMFWNQSTSPGSTDPWVRSANVSSSVNGFFVIGRTGYLAFSSVDVANMVRPAFQIDLSKVEWTK